MGCVADVAGDKDVDNGYKRRIRMLIIEKDEGQDIVG